MTKKIKGCESRGYVGVLGDMFLAQTTGSAKALRQGPV